MGNKLIFDPVNKTLHDPRGQKLKHVNCPRSKSWQLLVQDASCEGKQRLCDSCDRAVLDTEKMTPAEIIRIVNEDPEVYIRIGLSQENIEIKVYNG